MLGWIVVLFLFCGLIVYICRDYKTKWISKAISAVYNDTLAI